MFVIIRCVFAIICEKNLKNNLKPIKILEIREQFPVSAERYSIIKIRRKEMTEEIESVRLYCPNCGQRNFGYRNDRGAVLLKCSKCRCCISSRKMKEQRLVITVSKKIQ